jgi:hypothetical protein
MTLSKYTRKEYRIEDICYLAGIVDGEGSLYIGNFSCNKKTGVPHYQTNLAIANTEKGLIEWLVSVFGGMMREYTPKQTPKNSRKKVYSWTTSGERLTHICELIHPYSTIKKREIEIMLAMRETYEPLNTKKGIQGTRALPESVLIFRKQCFDELRSLHNRKGPLT